MLLSGCGGGFQGSSSARVASYKPESNYDDSPKPITPEPGYTTITVQGKAEFDKRKLAYDTSTGLNRDWYLSNELSRHPIPCAELNVLNDRGEIVQADATDENGNFSITLSSKPATYTMRIRSRANNSCLKVSVLEDIVENKPYDLSKTLVISGSSKSNFDLLASAIEYKLSENSPVIVESGAFNILYQIYLANRFLRESNAFAAGTSASKATIYWKAGFTPFSYSGSPNSPISYYEPGLSKLYICGGIQGDVASSDTDHFDDSVILHEYGHFLEDVYSKSDSPGGSHNGNFIIDPRLAWSEGWANFFQSAVKKHFNDPTKDYYVDTIGHKTSPTDSTGFRAGVKFILHADADNLSTGDMADKPIESGEGTFRELAIARTLYKTISTTYEGGATGANLEFENIWDSFTAFKDSESYITNFALFASLLKSSLVSKSKWTAASANITSIYDEERQPASTKEYGSSLVEGASSCAIEMSTAINEYYGSQWRSNQLRSNDFHVVYYNGSSPLTIELERTSGASIDLDLNIYKRDYVYKELSSSSSNSTLLRWSTTRSTTAKESVSFSGLAAGYYIVNIKAYSAESVVYSGGTAFYQLRNTQGTSGGYLCPNNLNTL